MPQPAASGCSLLSVTLQTFEMIIGVLIITSKQYFHVSPWSVLMKKFRPDIRYNLGLLLINHHI